MARKEGRRGKGGREEKGGWGRREGRLGSREGEG